MKRRFFIASAAGAICVSSPLLAVAGLTKRVRIEMNMATSDWRKWYCGSAVVWLNSASGIYHHKDHHCYGRTKQGAYACEKQAIAAGNRANFD